MAVSSQRSFASGEISPSLHSRVDFFKYATGLKTCHNGIIMRHGGWANRPGTKFVGENPVGEIKLVPFVVNSSLSYVLEFSDKRIRIVKGDDFIYDHTLDAQNNSKPGETRLHFFISASSDEGYAAGDMVYFDGYAAGVEVANGKTLLVDEVITDGFGNYFIVVTALDGTALQHSQITDFSEIENLTIKRCYSITTPYSSSELAEIQYVQSSETLTVVHKSHDPKNIKRASDADWAIEDLVFKPSITHPLGLNAPSGPSGTDVHKYTVTAVSEDNFEESIPGAVNLTGDIAAGADGDPITLSNPQSFDVPSGHGLEVGDRVHVNINAGSTITGLENTVFTVVSTDTTSVSINFDGTKYSDLGPFTYVTGDKITPAFAKITAGSPVASDPVRIRWENVVGAAEYNVYKESNGVYGLIGVSNSDTLLDIGVEPDTSKTPPTGGNPFAAPGDKPGAVTYIQQRLALGNTENDPQKIITSRTGKLRNFTKSKPIQDDDSITFSISGRQRNEVNHMFDLGKLVILTSGGEWSAEGDAAGIIRPTDINLRQHTYNGSNKLIPVIVDGSALYVQSKGSIIRDLGFSYEVDGYKGNDLTIFASHMFDNYTLVDWTYQQTPNSIVWAVRDDGALLGLTLVREQQLLAWHRHTFQDGSVKSASSVPGGDEDHLYLVIERTINGESRKYLERLTTRKVDDVQDSIFMDSAISYDGRNTDDSLTMTIYEYPNGGGWTYEDTFQINASGAYFDASGDSDVGNAIHFTDSNGDPVKLTITSVQNSTQALAQADKNIPEELQGDATSTWTYAVNEVAGLAHLEGGEVSVFADGDVISSPNNDNSDTLTVSGGKVSLPANHGVIHVGLPYMSEMETLNIDTAQGETLSNKKINIQHVTAFIEKSRGMWVGAKPPSDDATDPLENLREVKIRDDEGYESPVDLKTGKVDINLKSEWNGNGRVFIRQVDPLPLSILSIFPAGHIPYR